MKVKFLWLIILTLFLLLAGLFFIFVFYQVFTPVSSQLTETVFTIQKGEGLKEIASHLEESGLIRSKFWFISYVFYQGWAAQLQAGQYSLNPYMSIPQIAEKIVRGEVIFQEVKITIPEGFTLKQIDQRLSQFGLIEVGQILEQADLEGYLFPDTYQFRKGASLDEIISEMRDNFELKLDENLRKEITRQKKTIKEIIIMASLLEKEVPLYQDQRIVSGIFWKRLRDNYPLQSCATIAYVLDVDKWRYSIVETKIDSPYNTYQNIGLPPGPINSPGLLAIKAAVYPQTTNYYFFLSKPDGETVFSRTFEEHSQNIDFFLE